MPFGFRTQNRSPRWLYLHDAPVDDEAQRQSDEQMLDALQKAAFAYFPKHTHPTTGLVADASRDGAPSSIAAVGFALACYPIGVERGWIDRAEAVRLALLALRFFDRSDQSGQPGSTGHRGFYFHFLDMTSGARTWQSELSMVDTSLLVAGCLTAALYFTGPSPAESELRALADTLYRRVDWTWAQDGKVALMHGWMPEHGFLSYGWEGYSEALLMYALGLGSPTHPLGPESYHAWTLTYQWENLYGYDVLYAGPLFIHQLSHAWIDLRGLRDDFMREKDLDYFENSRRATYVHREYGARNPLGFAGYGRDCWGLSAGDGPTSAPMLIEGRQQRFYGYAARGAPYGPDDGTIAGSGAIGSLVFAPEIVLPVVRKLVAWQGGCDGRKVLASGFNASVPADGDAGWISGGQIGFDQGLIMMAIENHRSGLHWRLGRDSAPIRLGLERAGFRGGWLG